MKTKKSTHVAAMAALAAAGLCLAGCSRETRQDIIDGADQLNNPGGTVPRVVRDQQRKERNRQNNEWTAENRAEHPVEYCNAMLEALKPKETTLAAAILRIAGQKSETNRKLAKAKTDAEADKKALDKLKAFYRQGGEWPRKLGEKTYTEEEAKDLILAAGKRVADRPAEIAALEKTVRALEKRHDEALREQKRFTEIRGELNATIDRLKVKQASGDVENIRNTLENLGDSLRSLGDGLLPGDDPLEDLYDSIQKDDRDAAFDDIMKD